MEGKRIYIVVVIILALLALLFVVGIGWGIRNDAKGEGDMSPEEFSEQPNPYPWTGAFGEWLRPFSPKLKLGRSTFVVAPGASISNILVPSSDQSFRTGTFFLRSGLKADVVYRANVQTSGPLDNPQKLELPRKRRDEKDEPRRGTLAVVKTGGTLEIHCLGTVPCTVEIE